MARPTKLTPQTQARICQLLRKGVPRERSSRLAGVDPATFHRWMGQGLEEEEGQLHHEFRKAVLRAEDSLVDRMMASVVDAFEVQDCTRCEGAAPDCPACRGSGQVYVHELRERTTAARFVALRFPGDFASKHEVTGADGGPVRVEAAVTVRPLLSDEQIAGLDAEKLMAAIAGLAQVPGPNAPADDPVEVE